MKVKDLLLDDVLIKDNFIQIFANQYSIIVVQIKNFNMSSKLKYKFVKKWKTLSNK